MLFIVYSYWLTGVLSTIVYSVIQWHTKDLIILANSFFKFILYMHGTYYPSFDPNKSKGNLLLDMFLHVYAFAAASSFILISLILIYDPTAVIFLGDLIPDQYFILPVRFLIILFHGYLLLIVHAGIVCVGSAIFVYSFYLPPILIRELRMGRSNYKMEDKLRHPQNVRHVYRCLQIIQANTLCFMGLFIVMSNAIFMMTSLYCNFVLVRYWDKLEMVSKAQLVIWAVTVSGSWTFVLELGRFLFVKGKKVLGSWRGDKWGSNRENKLMKKFNRSCKPIVLGYGRQFVIGRVSVLVFFRGVTRGMFRALLTTKK